MGDPTAGPSACMAGRAGITAIKLLEVRFSGSTDERWVERQRLQHRLDNREDLPERDGLIAAARRGKQRAKSEERRAP
jgi:hypothetical protein